MILFDTQMQEAGKRLKEAKRILVASHIRPDGDAIGSMLGLGLALEKAEKQVQTVLSDGIPASFRHLPGSEKVRKKAEGQFDLICVVDCSDLERTGSAIDGLGQPDLNIDHHITNTGYARTNLVNEHAAATAEILAQALPAWGYPIASDVADNLLTGMITDTIGFRTNSVRPETLRIAALLVEAGADLHRLYNKALNSRSFEAARFWGAGLSSLERDEHLIWATLSLKDRRETGYPGRDDADLVNILSSIQDGYIGVIFVEQPGEKVKVSWRSQPGYDVSQIALQFGGGGHPAASGAELNGTLEEVRPKVLNATRKLLDGSNHKNGS